MRPLRAWSRSGRSTGLLLCAVAAAATAPVLLDAPALGTPTAPGFTLAGTSTMTAASAELTGLVYQGVVTVTLPAGDVQVLELTSSAATLTGLGLHTPCTAAAAGGATTTDTLTATGSTSTAAGGLTLYATSIAATVGGSPVTWTPAAPPPAEQLGDATLTDATVDLVALSAPSLVLPPLRQATSFCTP
jgi:hypothetical protein